jgi:hypothetical protein
MRSRRISWLSTSALLVGLVMASPIPSATVSASQTGKAGQILDPTLQALATEAARAAAEATLIPTPNPTVLARAIDQAGAITLQGTLTITGAVELSAPYTSRLLNLEGIRPDAVSCAAFAQGIRNGDGTGFGVPYPPLTATLAGHTVVIPVSVSPYPGPGVYSRDHGLQLGPGVVIYDVTVDPDGSGSFTFANLHAASWSADPTSEPSISGSDTWSCSQGNNP